MHADEVVSNMFDSLEVVRIAAPGALICNQCCLQRQQQWCVAVACPLPLNTSRSLSLTSHAGEAAHMHITRHVIH